MKATDMPKGFTCECGLYHPFSAYVYAHWTQRLTHACPCGRKHLVYAGDATLIETATEKGE